MKNLETTEAGKMYGRLYFYWGFHYRITISQKRRRQMIGRAFKSMGVRL